MSGSWKSTRKDPTMQWLTFVDRRHKHLQGFKVVLDHVAKQDCWEMRVLRVYWGFVLFWHAAALVVLQTPATAFCTRSPNISNGLYRKGSVCFGKTPLFAVPGDNDNDISTENISLKRRRLPVRTIVLGIIGLFAASNLSSEVPRLFTSQADYIGTAFDGFMVSYAIQNVLQQIGGTNSAASANVMDQTSSLEGLECSVTVDVGRESGTWMPKDWASSGGRLQFPINVLFTNEDIDLGIPGEEALGGRYCKKLKVLTDEADSTAAKFVGQTGQVSVRVLDGGWAALPLRSEPGASKLRFFLDFPEDVVRNDVTIPAGRVFFSGVGWKVASEAPADLQGRLIESPLGGVAATDGGLTIQKNGIANLYGALGDINLILGRYQMGPLKK